MYTPNDSGTLPTAGGRRSALPLWCPLNRDTGRLASTAYQSEAQMMADEQAALKLQEEKTCERLSVYLAQKIRSAVQAPDMFADLIQREVKCWCLLSGC